MKTKIARLAGLLALSGYLNMALAARNSQLPPALEQVVFSRELDSVPLKNPVVVPENALQQLRKDELFLNATKACLKDGESPDRIPSAWFVGSEIHLRDTKEVDLVVIPIKECISGANVGPFWILRDGNKYQVLLSAGGHTLSILGSRRMGYKDIQIESATAAKRTRATYGFNGRHYKLRKLKASDIQ